MKTGDTVVVGKRGVQALREGNIPDVLRRAHRISMEIGSYTDDAPRGAVMAGVSPFHIVLFQISSS